MSTQDYVTQIWLMVTTAMVDDANSVGSVQLGIGLPTLDVVLDTAPLMNSRQALNSRNRSAQFTWTPNSTGTLNWSSASFTLEQVRHLQLQIAGTKSDDWWLPSSVWVITKSDVSGYQVLSAYPEWPKTDAFSTETRDNSGNARSSYKLSVQGATTGEPVPAEPMVVAS